MKPPNKREKILFWGIKNSTTWWLTISVILVASVLGNTGMPLLVGLGITIFGVLAFCAGINTALEGLLGDNYAQKLEWDKKAKEKKNDTTH